ncbi:MAG: InlB B-repeat-containing protein [Clostridiaceae bacterium]|nr:InlB B-repeat-containing protein [Clostridiaceae bacterium]
MANANAVVPGSTRYYAPGTKVKLADYDDVITEPVAGLFMGWNTEADRTGTAYMPGDVITINSDLNLYPMWEYIITFDGNGNTDGSLPPRQISSGGTIVLPQQDTLDRQGYVFAGWTTDRGQFYYPGTTVEVNKSTTFYASWIKTYKITYDANGGDTGTVPVDNTAYMEDTAAIVKGNTGYLKKGSKVFDYWNTKPDGSGETYKPGDSIVVSADTTLYAFYTDPSGDIPIIFIPNFCELSYNGNMNDGGSVPENPTIYTGGTKVEIKGNTGNLSRSGYRFIGWNTRPDGSGLTFQDGDILTIPQDRDAVTLFAMWQKESGGSGYSSRAYLEPYHYYDFGDLKVYYISYISKEHDGETLLREQDDGPKGYEIYLPYCGTLYKSGYHFAGWKYETIK